MGLLHQNTWTLSSIYTFLLHKIYVWPGVEVYNVFYKHLFNGTRFNLVKRMRYRDMHNVYVFRFTCVENIVFKAMPGISILYD